MSKNATSTPILTGDLRIPWLITGGSMLLLLLSCSGAAYFEARLPADFTWPEASRVQLRTLLYWLAILTLPLTNLIRHIQLRLNQTMPTSTSAKRRYCLTVLISMLLCETIGVFGLWLFCVGDGWNSFIIFTCVSALGLFLYRPKLTEYHTIVAALANKQP